MKKILLLIFLLTLLFLSTINAYAIDMPGITSNEAITNNRNSNKNLLKELKNHMYDLENDNVMYYSVITFVSISFISLFIIYKKGKRQLSKKM